MSDCIDRKVAMNLFLIYPTEDDDSYVEDEYGSQV